MCDAIYIYIHIMINHTNSPVDCCNTFIWIIPEEKGADANAIAQPLNFKFVPVCQLETWPAKVGPQVQVEKPFFSWKSSPSIAAMENRLRELEMTGKREKNWEKQNKLGDDIIGAVLCCAGGTILKRSVMRGSWFHYGTYEVRQQAWLVHRRSCLLKPDGGVMSNVNT